MVAPGTVLADRFEVVGPPLGEGATGVVYPAVDRASGEAVAAKVLHAHLVDDPGALARLKAEAGAAGRLHHRGIVGVVGLWADLAGQVLVTARVDGIALHAIDSPLAPEAVVALGIQLADALVAAHSGGLVHGDVRPGNVLLGRRGACLFDFGVAGWVATGPEAASLRAGETAPEVWAGAPPGVPADLYGLGIVLHRALRVRSAFEGATPWAVLARQRDGSATPWDGPRGLVELVCALLQPDPSDRPRDAAAVRTALRRLSCDPSRRLRLPRRWLPPVRPGRTWVVHGRDPATGGPVVIRAGVSRRAANELVERLDAHGWTATTDREALGLGDLGVMAVASVVGGVILPFVGAPIALGLALRWRAAELRPQLRDALATPATAVPPRQVSPGADAAILAGLLMLTTAAAMVWWPVAALVPAASLALLLVVSWRARLPDAALLARAGRVAAALADLRGLLERPGLPLDRCLGVLGELEALEHGWRQGDVAGDELLVRTHELRTEVADALDVDDGPGATLDALRRASDPR